MIFGVTGLAATILKAGGFGIAASFASHILEMMGKPTLAKLLHVGAWLALGIFSIDLLMDYCRATLSLWGGHHW